MAGFVHSSVFHFFYEQSFGALRMAGGYMQFQAPQLRAVPFRMPTDDQASEVSRLVQSIEALGGCAKAPYEMLLLDNLIMDVFMVSRLDRRSIRAKSLALFLMSAGLTSTDLWREYVLGFSSESPRFTEWLDARQAETATEIGAVRALLKRGEDESLEFKASVAWDMRQDKYNLVMRDEVLKEICAFLNADGGTILCGVDDDGTILGLAKDLKQLGNRDKVGLLITNAFGDLLKPNPVELVKMKFLQIDGESILRIEVTGDPQRRYESPSVKKEDAGKNIPRTHVRIHGSAKALDVGDAIAWWGRRSGDESR